MTYDIPTLIEDARASGKPICIMDVVSVMDALAYIRRSKPEMELDFLFSLLSCVRKRHNIKDCVTNAYRQWNL